MKPGKYCDEELHTSENDISDDLNIEVINMLNLSVESESKKVETDDQTNVESKNQNMNNLGVIFPQTRSKSPVTVHDWVAALPDNTEDGDDDEDSVREECHTEDNDNLTLGAEAGGLIEPGVVAKLFFEHSSRSKRASGAVLQHTDTLTSIRSDLSQNSTSSMSCILQSRQADPEQVLLNLGFAGSEVLTRIPERFLKHPSQAKGISIDAFKKQQDDLIGSFESGFFGYRGLSGCLHRRPSGMVEKILNTLKEREKEKQRNGSTLPWTSPTYSSAIPSRFKRMDPKRTTFDSLVTQVAKTTEKAKVNPKSFKSLAKSVLSPENRVWRQEQIDTNKRKATQLLVMGGKSFLVDDEGNEEEIIKHADECRKISSPIQIRLKKQDSVQSLQSCNSFESDWSDEEKGELEKQFGGMRNRCKISEVEEEDLLKRPRRRSNSRKRNIKTTPGMDIGQLVYSRESSVTVSDVASSSLDEGVVTFGHHCIPEEVEVGKNL